MQTMLPNYRNCSLNIIASLLFHYREQEMGDGEAWPRHRRLPFLDALLARKKYKNIVLMLFDGLGIASLENEACEAPFLKAHIARQLSAVFPPTTVAATTTIESGLSPAEHAWLGWSMYFSEIDKTIDTFLNRDSITHKAAAEYDIAKRYIPYVSLFSRLNRVEGLTATLVSRFAEGFGKAETLEGLFDAALRLCSEPGRQYIYIYYPEPDHTMHLSGVNSAEAMAHIREIDRHAQAFCNQAGEDTLVLITADHGLTDCRFLYLDDHKDLTDMLERRPSIESRAAAFFVRPECRDDFPAVFEKAFGKESFLLLHSEKALSGGLFGPGKIHPRTRGFLGDYLSIARDCYGIAWCEKDAPHMIGMHAGISEYEMRVPLIVGRV